MIPKVTAAEIIEPALGGLFVHFRLEGETKVFHGVVVELPWSIGDYSMSVILEPELRKWTDSWASRTTAKWAQEIMQIVNSGKTTELNCMGSH